MRSTQCFCIVPTYLKNIFDTLLRISPLKILFHILFDDEGREEIAVLAANSDQARRGFKLSNVIFEWANYDIYELFYSRKHLLTKSVYMHISELFLEKYTKKL